MRIAVVINELNSGGAERMVVEQIARTAGVEFQVAWISPGNELQPALIRLGVPTHDLSRGQSSAIHRLLAFVRQTQPDLIHAHLPRAGAMSIVVGALAQVPVLYTEHNVWRGYRRLSWPLAFVAARRATRVIAVSHAVERSTINHTRLDAARITTIYNGVDLANLTETAYVRRSPVRLCTIANLYKRKGLNYLIAALSEARRDADVVLEVFGDGPERQHLARQALDLGLQSAVVFHGHVALARAMLPTFDGYVSSSIVEGHPVAILEAMGSGLPTIATKAGGTSEIIEDENNGLLVPPADSRALAVAIRRCADDPALRRRLGEAGRSTVVERFDSALTARAYLREYRTLLRGSE